MRWNAIEENIEEVDEYLDELFDTETSIDEVLEEDLT